MRIDGLHVVGMAILTMLNILFFLIWDNPFFILAFSICMVIALYFGTRINVLEVPEN